MIYVNALSDQGGATKAEYELLLQLLNPFAPHMTEEVFHGAAFSKSPMNISYRRSVSAPYSLTTSSGLTTLPRDLDILTMGCSAISPYFSTRALRAPFSSPYSASRRLRSASGWF